MRGQEIARGCIWRALVIGSAAILSACIPYVDTDWRSIPLDQASVKPSSKDALRVGDVVRVKTLAGKSYHYKVVELAENGFWGTQKDRYKYQVPYSSLKRMQVERDELRFIAGFGRIGL